MRSFLHLSVCGNCPCAAPGSNIGRAGWVTRPHHDFNFIQIFAACASCFCFIIFNTSKKIDCTRQVCPWQRANFM